MRNAFVRNSKNLFDWTNYTAGNKVSLSFDKGVLSAVNSGSSAAQIDFEMTCPAGIYTILHESAITAYYYINNGGGYTKAQPIQSGTSSTVTTTSSSSKIRVRIFVEPNGVTQLVRMQINKGTKALPYVPHHKISQVKALAVARNPANLFNVASAEKFSGFANIDERTGNTITVSTNGQYTSANFPITASEGESITINGAWSVSGQNRGEMRVMYVEESGAAVGGIIARTTTSGVSASGVVTARPTSTAKLCIMLYANSGINITQIEKVVYSNVVVNKGTTAEPYFKMQKFKIDCKEV